MSKKIGIIYSPGYGAGWSSWGCPEMALDQELAEAIENEEPFEKWLEIAQRNWPDECYGGLADCVVEWVEEGTQFNISEYDGYESIKYRANSRWSVAQ